MKEFPCPATVTTRQVQTLKPGLQKAILQKTLVAHGSFIDLWQHVLDMSKWKLAPFATAALTDGLAM
eukprot:5442528-Amphidinium_carterae.2